MKWPFAGALLIVASLAFAPAIANAAPVPASGPSAGPGPVVQAPLVVSDEELSRNRGGFNWEGVEISLGAEMRTFIDGALVLQTNISWTSTGATTTRFVSGALTPADAAQLQAGILSGGGIAMRVGDQSVFLANAGQTALIQGPEGAIQNILVNRANNVSIRQEVDATLDLRNFGPFQQQTMLNRLGDSLGSAMNAATFGALDH
ncbi:MAG TPA: hypothetical protein VHE36_06055 [Sphingomicrobium sp.]|jgi:hypothetical protein|nr:hypothetical protein [Sphingomicrobium sp.]